MHKREFDFDTIRSKRKSEQDLLSDEPGMVKDPTWHPLLTL
jgi:hypothetical protein